MGTLSTFHMCIHKIIQTKAAKMKCKIQMSFGMLYTFQAKLKK